MNIFFTKAFADYLKRIVNDRRNPVRGLNEDIVNEIVRSAKEDPDFAFGDMFPLLSDMRDTAQRPVVLIIDEVDSASNNQVFLDFLAQLRGYYLNRRKMSIFQSVIPAGVHDVKNIGMKIRPDAEHKVNSLWNISSEFNIDMSFNPSDIGGMPEHAT